MNLKTLREKADLSRDDISKMLKRNIHTIEKYETSHTLPHIEVLIQLADLYRVDYNTIVDIYKYHKKKNLEHKRNLLERKGDKNGTKKNV